MEQTSGVSVQEIEQFILQSGSDNVSVFGGKFEGGVNCQQVPDEFAEFICDVLKSGQKIENYLEIGVASGGTTYILNHYFAPKNIVLIDDNMHIKAPMRPGILAGVNRKEIIGKSNSDAVKQEAAALKLKYDLIVIDGDHTYQGVKADADNYIPCLKDKGLVVFHDSCLSDWGVLKVVAELKESKAVEFVCEYKSKNRAPLGIAAFRKAKK